MEKTTRTEQAKAPEGKGAARARRLARPAGRLAAASSSALLANAFCAAPAFAVTLTSPPEAVNWVCGFISAFFILLGGFYVIWGLYKVGRGVADSQNGMQISDAWGNIAGGAILLSLGLATAGGLLVWNLASS